MKWRLLLQILAFLTKNLQCWSPGGVWWGVYGPRLEGRFCGIGGYSMEKAPNEPQNSAITSHDIRLSGKYPCVLMTSCSFGLEIEWRKTTAPGRVVFPF